MKHRVTYIKPPEVALEEDNVRVSKDALVLNSLAAAKEHRVTVGLSELPKELRTALEQCHELHVRWASPRPVAARSPYLSRVSSGLHVFYTPRKGYQSDELCPTLKNLFSQDLKCSSQAESFTNPSILSERFATSASSQYFSYLRSLETFSRYLQDKICGTDSKTCNQAAISLLTADRLDIDYDTISRAVVIAVYWDSSHSQDGKWTEKLSVSNLQSSRIEVGILSEEQASSAEELKVNGILSVIGEDERPKATRFSFPSRHHTLGSPPSNSKERKSPYFTAAFDKPIGLHPTYRISLFNITPPPNNPTCALHAYLTLPSTIFLDRYAFRDAIFLRSHNLASLRTISGATDLEAPEWSVSQWGSAALFELAPPPFSHPSQPRTPARSDHESVDNDSEIERNGENETEVPKAFNATIPLHTRYLVPSPGGYCNTTLPYPVIFYACKALDEDSPPLHTNPFDRVNLGFDGLFGERTVFWHVPPLSFTSHTSVGAASISTNESGMLVETIQIPVLDLNRSTYIELGTVVTVVLGCVWVVWCLFGPLGGYAGEGKVKMEKGTGREKKGRERDGDVKGKIEGKEKDGGRAVASGVEAGRR